MAMPNHFAERPGVTGLSVEGVSFFYGSTEILRDIRLEVREGEFLCLLGPSGSGKTTLLRLLAGLELPASGTVRWKGKVVRGPGTERGLVFQDYSLYPWMTLAQNVSLALEKSAPDAGKRERAALADEYLSLVGLEGAGRKHPFELSGGMQQRGAIARALALGSPVLLLDEPFGALDPVNRARLQDLVSNIWNSASPRKTVVFVTHDVEEALYLGDRVVVLGSTPGRVIGEFEVRLARPRPRRETFAEAEFHRLRDEISEHYRLDVYEKMDGASIVRGEAEGI